MSVKDDLNSVSVRVKRSIARFVRKLLKEQQGIHTIIIDKVPGTKTARQFTDFELLVLYNMESEKEEVISESGNYSSSGRGSGNCRIFSPGRSYRISQAVPHADEYKALIYRFPYIYKRKEPSFRKCLQDHLKFFTINDYMDITVINSPEMEKSNPIFYELFTTYRFDKGHVIYNSLGKPYVTMRSLEDLN